MRRTATLGAVWTVWALAGVAAGQSVTGAPSSGMGGSGAGAAASGPPPLVVEDLDLPLSPPTYQGPPLPTPRPPAPPAPPAPPPMDDPRDTPPPTIYGEEIVSENDTLVYVIDHSGSMQLDPQGYLPLVGGPTTGTRMERAKNEISRSIQGLSPNFRFNVVAFDCATMTWQASLVQATDANKQSALAWVARLQPTGATGTGPATALALADKGNRLVVLLTDGAPNCGVPEFDASTLGDESLWLASHRRLISGANTQGARVNVFGIAASGLYRQFCQDVANDSGGAYVDVP
mgnify:CR=1 FL=1